ncbi:hypothetical protein B0H66DRAFT_640663 [Apodospora peruviana]|uniref:DUF8021 domain-containing protein n=1 Tax=Apodospora peruviana TaxID=516989 RepID=A0AAE0I787_9PEZI|nr:hypothetical protein B0H66DRAFT_640663 [Apodospora peruviana]
MPWLTSSGQASKHQQLNPNRSSAAMFSLVAVLVSLGVLASQGASAACTRDMLKAATAEYLEALTAGKPTTLKSLAEGTVPYQENDVVMDISKGVLSQGIAIDFNRSIYDTTECASYTEVVATAKHPYVIGTRLAFTDTKITKIESVVCDDGDWLFNAAGSLKYNKQEVWDVITEAKRDKREVIKAAGDAYIDAWGDSSIQPPFSKQCARLEGGSYLTGNCKLNFSPPFKVTNRRYTIDEELGAVDIFHNFPFLDKFIPRDPGTQTNNLMRVESGQIKYIHENTVCSKKSCAK